MSLYVNMDEEKLLAAGLARNEAKVYIALLKLGLSSVTELSKESGVDRTLIYGILDKLSEKGLVASIIKSNKQLFEPANPDKLLDLIKEKEQSVQDVLPDLQQLFSSNTSKQEVYHFKGKEGVQTVLETLLKENSNEWLIFGANEKTAEILPYYLPQFHRKRIEKKMLFKGIYSKGSKRISELQNIALVEIKSISEEYLTPTHINIVGEKVGIILWSNNPLGIIIHSKDIANSFTQYFLTLWNIAK